MENFCLTFLRTLTGLTSKAKDVPSSSANPIAKFLFRKSLWERLGLGPGISGNTFASQGYMTALFLYGASSPCLKAAFWI